MDEQPTRFYWDTHSPRSTLCNKWCKIHRYYDFHARWHMWLPHTWNYHSNTHGWRNVEVFVGPPGYYPKKPTPLQWEDIQRVCPHTQTDLTCNTCLRHTFRPREF